MQCINNNLWLLNGHPTRVKWSPGANLIYCRDALLRALFDLIIFAGMNRNKPLLLWRKFCFSNVSFAAWYWKINDWYTYDFICSIAPNFINSMKCTYKSYNWFISRNPNYLKIIGAIRPTSTGEWLSCAWNPDNLRFFICTVS